MPLPEDQNAFHAEVVDAFGNTSNRVAATFTVDTIPPAITDLLPASGSVTNVTPAKLSGRISEPATLRVGGQALGVLNDRSFTFDAPLREGLNSLLLEATDVAGNTGSRTLAVTLDTVLPEFIDLKPVTGSITNLASIEITGKLSEKATLTLGADLLPLANDNSFAKTVPLAEGANVFVFKAADGAGNTAARTISLIRDTVAPKLLNLTPANGTAVNVAQVRIGGAFDDAKSVTITGTGGMQSSSGTVFAFDEVLQVGANVFVIRATDGAGNVTEENVTLTWAAYDPVDAPLMVVWDSMNNALKTGDINKALTYLTTGAQEKYRPVFEALIVDMPAIIASYSKPSRGLLSDDMAEYAIMRFIEAEGDTQIFFIYFLKGGSGKWLVDSM